MTDDDFDFTKPTGAPAAAASPAPAPPVSIPSAPAAPAKSRFYDAVIARKLFEAAGTREELDAGSNFFVEHEKASRGGLFSKAVVNRMFFIAEGEVSLTAGGKMLDTVRAGEIFGEMAVITGGSRSATATAKTRCVAYALDVTGFQAALSKTAPEFALMLMSVMFDRLRLVAARLAARKVATNMVMPREAATFPPDMLAKIEEMLPNATSVRYDAGKSIMREGERGVNMYIVTSGSVAIAIRDNPVETISQGGCFGEMALVDQSPRTASATAATDCTLLAINRNTLIAVVREQPAFGVALLRAVAERLRHMNSLLATQ